MVGTTRCRRGYTLRNVTEHASEVRIEQGVRFVLDVGGAAFLGYMVGLYYPLFSTVALNLCVTGSPCRDQTASSYAVGGFGSEYPRNLC